MSKYIVEEFTLCGWENTWSDDEGATVFNTKAEAQAELDWFIHDCQEAFDNGELADVPEREDYRIVEVNDADV